VDLSLLKQQSRCVGSVKGGVGKTTVAVNLAVALGMTGAKVGLLDADVYGPNVPIMMGDCSAPQVAEHRLTPLERHGVRFISLGSLMPEDAPVIWRGPMVNTTLRQLFRDAAWGRWIISWSISHREPATHH
jgi:ATP-binding protein involved in chromosome partitioning